eukprot:1159075-Pelagomonas_calceolata.AAC.9
MSYESPDGVAGIRGNSSWKLVQRRTGRAVIAHCSVLPNKLAETHRAMMVNMSTPPCKASRASVVVVWGADSRQCTYVDTVSRQKS